MIQSEKIGVTQIRKRPKHRHRLKTGVNKGAY